MPRPWAAERTLRLPRQLGRGLGRAGPHPPRRPRRVRAGRARRADLAARARAGGLLGAVEPTPVTDNVMGYKWAKLIYASLLFATAVVDAHVYDVIERSPGVQRALCALVGEGLAVADKAGIRIDPFDEFDPAWYRAALHGDAAALGRAMATAAAHYRGNTKTKTGVWRDLAVRRRKTEVDGLLGVLARKGEALGVAHAAHPPIDRDHPGHRGRPAPDGLGEPRPAGRPRVGGQDRSPNAKRGGPSPMSRLAFHALLALAVVGPACARARARRRGAETRRHADHRAADRPGLARPATSRPPRPAPGSTSTCSRDC